MVRRLAAVGRLAILGVAALVACPSAADTAAHVETACSLVCLVEVGTDGHGQRLLTTSVPDPLFDLSPDRTRMLYSRDRGGLYTSRIDRSDERLVAADADVGDAAFSPNGARIVFLHWPPDDPQHPAVCGGEEIGTVATDGSDLRTFQRCAFHPAWAPDSRRLLFAPDSPTMGGVWAVARLDGAGRHDVGLWEERSGYSPSTPEWSPRGDAIAYETWARPRPPSGHGTYSGGPARVPETEVDIVRSDGTVVAVLDRTAQPSWSPDGLRLAFLRIAPRDSLFGDAGESSLWIGRADGSGARLIRKQFWFGVSWSPNGRLLAFVDGGEIFVLRPDGTQLRQITHNSSGGSIDALWWSPDGFRIAYLWECTQEFEPCD